MKIGNIFNRKPEASQIDNAVDAKKSIINALLSRFKQLRFNEGDGNIRQVTIWVADPVYIRLIKNDDFVTSLHTEIENHLITALTKADIIVRMGKPSSKIQSSCILENAIWFSFLIEEEIKKKMNGKARITIAGGRGSMMKKTYDLNVMERTVFHIGRGESETNKERPFRENQIAINDLEKDKALKELNFHVSGTHADLIYDNEAFYLKATPYGCRPDGSKTAVIREGANGSEEYELRDSESRFRLRDGDLIELGGVVMLLFECKE